MLVIAAAAAVGVSGCAGHTTIVRTVTGGANGGSGQSGSQSGSSHPASVGEPLTLQGPSGETMRVTVLRVVDPEQGGQMDTPDQGDRFVGVFVQLTNVGQVPYDDSPSNGATLLSTSNEQANSATLSEGECSSDFSSSAKIAPGESQTGCIAFQMQNGQQPGEFQFTLASGFGNQTGEWLVSGSSSSATSGAAGTSPSSGTSAPSGSLTQCDPNISAGSGTTCSFAENVFKAYAAFIHSSGQTSGTVQANSPVTGQSYSMSCSGDPVVCTGGNNAYVTFPLHAAQVY